MVMIVHGEERWTAVRVTERNERTCGSGDRGDDDRYEYDGDSGDSVESGESDDGEESCGDIQ